MFDKLCEKQVDYSRIKFNIIGILVDDRRTCYESSRTG